MKKIRTDAKKKSPEEMQEAADSNEAINNSSYPDIIGASNGAFGPTGMVGPVHQISTFESVVIGSIFVGGSFLVFGFLASFMTF